MRLQALKCKVAAEERKVEAEEQRTRNLFTHNQGLQAECDRLRVQRDGEQQLLAADRAQGDRVIADRVSELRRINDLIFAAKERQRELETIEEVSERSKGSDETDEVDEASPVHGGAARDKSNVLLLCQPVRKFLLRREAWPDRWATFRDSHLDQWLLR